MADKPTPRKPASKAKKPWQRPAVKTGRLFESNSLACGKNDQGIEDCFQKATQS